jgi:putative transcriptional regulator
MKTNPKTLEPQKGHILIAEPFLADPNFHRSAVLITEYNAQGSVGFVLNQKTVLTVADLFDDIDITDAVYLGGPVRQDSFHFIHNNSALADAIPIRPGLYWGGNFDHLISLYHEELLPAEFQVRYFAGYSGWAPGQMQDEIEQKSWIVIDAPPSMAFMPEEDMWKALLKSFGGQLSWMSNAPSDLSLN